MSINTKGYGYMKYIIGLFLICTMPANATNYVFIAEITNPAVIVSSYWYTNTIDFLPFTRFSVEVTEAQYGTPSQADYDALPDALISNALNARISVRVNAASNIVTLAAVYGVTNQPIPWATVATAMQNERSDATASNDIPRLLTVIGDGTTMLSFKEFYSENGGDILDVRWP